MSYVTQWRLFYSTWFSSESRENKLFQQSYLKPKSNFEKLLIRKIPLNVEVTWSKKNIMRP